MLIRCIISLAFLTTCANIYAVGTVFNQDNWSGYDTVTLANPSSSLSNFTVAINLSELSTYGGFGSKVQNDGADIRVTKSDGTELPFDLIGWNFNSGSPTGILRIKWTGSLASSGTHQIYIWTGYVAGTAVAYDANETYGSDNAYDANYMGYWPLSSDFNDRTSNNIDLSGNGSISAGGAAGAFGASTDFDGTNDYLNGVSSLPTQYTITATVYNDVEPTQANAPTGCYTTFAELPGSSTSDRGLGYEDVADVITGYHYDGTPKTATSNAVTPSGAWVCGGSTYSGIQVVAYANGSPGTPISAGNPYTGYVTPEFIIGRFSGGYFDGKMQHVSLHNVARSSAWMAYEYNQLMNNITFHTYSGWTNTIINLNTNLIAKWVGPDFNYPSTTYVRDGSGSPFVDSGSSTGIQILPGSHLSGKNNSTISFTIQSTDSSAVILTRGTAGGGYLLVPESGSSSTTLFSDVGSPSITIDGATFSGTTRDDLFNAICDGVEHECVLTNVDFTALASWATDGLYVGGYDSGAYQFNGSISNFTIDDVVYGPYAGTLNGGDNVDDLFVGYGGGPDSLLTNHGLTLDGSSDYISHSSISVPSNENWSYSIWLRTTESGRYAFGNYDLANLPGLVVNSTTVTVGRQNGSSTFSAPGLLDGLWHHYVAIFHDNSDISLYVDGYFISREVNAGGTATFNSIGRRLAGSYFNGSIGGIRIYERALDQVSITRLFEIGQSDRLNVGLLGRWVAYNTLYGNSVNIADVAGYDFIDNESTDGIFVIPGSTIGGLSDATIEFTFQSTDVNGVVFSTGAASSPYMLVFHDGNVGAISSGVGSPTFIIDGVDVTSGTRDDIHTALCDGQPHKVKITSVDFTSSGSWNTNGLYVGGYDASSFNLDGTVSNLTINGILYTNGNRGTIIGGNTLDQLYVGDWNGPGNNLSDHGIGLNGTSDYFDHAGITLDGAATLAMWVKRNSTNTFDLLFSDGVTNSQKFGFNTLSTQMFVRFGSLSNTTPSHGVADTTQWHHYTLTRDVSGNLSLYVDGNIVSSNFATGQTSSVTLNRIGTDVSNYTDGSIVDARIYNRKLPDSEIYKLYKFGVPTNNVNRRGINGSFRGVQSASTGVTR